MSGRPLEKRKVETGDLNEMRLENYEMLSDRKTRLKRERSNDSILKREKSDDSTKSNDSIVTAIRTENADDEEAKEDEETAAPRGAVDLRRGDADNEETILHEDIAAPRGGLDLTRPVAPTPAELGGGMMMGAFVPPVAIRHGDERTEAGATTGAYGTRLPFVLPHHNEPPADQISPNTASLPDPNTFVLSDSAETSPVRGEASSASSIAPGKQADSRSLSSAEASSSGGGSRPGSSNASGKQSDSSSLSSIETSPLREEARPFSAKAAGKQPAKDPPTSSRPPAGLHEILAAVDGSYGKFQGSAMIYGVCSRMGFRIAKTLASAGCTYILLVDADLKELEDFHQRLHQRYPDTRFAFLEVTPWIAGDAQKLIDRINRSMKKLNAHPLKYAFNYFYSEHTPEDICGLWEDRQPPLGECNRAYSTYRFLTLAQMRSESNVISIVNVLTEVGCGQQCLSREFLKVREGVETLTLWSSRHWAETKCRVNCVFPGFIGTCLHDIKRHESEVGYETVSQCALFLALSKIVNGTTLHANEGDEALSTPTELLPPFWLYPEAHS